MKINVHKVSRSSIEEGHIQTQNGAFLTEAVDVQPYGFAHHVPDEAMSVVCCMEGDIAKRYALINFLEEVPYGLEAGEVALYSQHGQVLYYKEDGTVHLEAKGKLSLHSDEEDLYSLLKDLLTAIKGITTEKIDTVVSGSATSPTPSTALTISGASGKNPGVGLSSDSTQKLDEIAQRLDKLLQKGEKPQSVEQQEQKKEEAQSKAAASSAEDSAGKTTENPEKKVRRIATFELTLEDN